MSFFFRWSYQGHRKHLPKFWHCGWLDPDDNDDDDDDDNDDDDDDDDNDEDDDNDDDHDDDDDDGDDDDDIDDIDDDDDVDEGLADLMVILTIGNYQMMFNDISLFLDLT